MMVPPKVGWTLFHQSAIKKTCPQTNLMEAFPPVRYPLLVSRFVSIWQQLYAKQASKHCPPPKPLSSGSIAWITTATHPLSCYKFLDKKSSLLVFLFLTTCIVIYFTSKMLDQYCKIASDLVTYKKTKPPTLSLSLLMTRLLRRHFTNVTIICRWAKQR